MSERGFEMTPSFQIANAHSLCPPLDPITPNTPHIIMKKRCYTMDGSIATVQQKVRCITSFFVLKYVFMTTGKIIKEYLSNGTI